uniref:Uncharacterized protein n=1 Tax=Amphiprion percula TaxID=161767 RepID=A0A3P8U949_AMPPE
IDPWISDSVQKVRNVEQSFLTRLPVVEWTESMHKAFVDVKTALVPAPALGMLDYMQPFQLYIREREGFVAYYLSGLCTVVRSMPGCLRSMAAVAALEEKSAPLVLSHDGVVYVTRLVMYIINIAVILNIINHI